MMNPIWQFVISTLISMTGIILTFLALSRLLKKDKEDHRKKLEESIDNAICALGNRLDEKIDKIESKNQTDINSINQRVSRLEEKTFQTLLDRLSTVEGKLDGISNVVNLLQRKAMGEDKN